MATASVTPHSLFVVSGGARGVTARCVVGLARHYGCRFLLLGRSPGGPPPAWADGALGDAALMAQIAEQLSAGGERATPAALRRRLQALRAQHEIAATLREVAAAGGAAEYLQADITDGPALRAALDGALARLGPATGLLHGAGVLADKRIEQKLAADFDAVYGPKITGLQNLLACLPPATLQHLVLFSSAAGFYGNPGQADYAMANEMLNRAAHLLRAAHPGCHTVALNWGPWDGGMVTPALRELFAQRGVAVIPVEAGVARLVDELATRAEQPPSILVGTPLPPPVAPAGGPQLWRLGRRLSLGANPFLGDHVIGGSAVLPATCAIAWMAQGCEQVLSGYRFFRCERYQVLKGIVFDGTLAPEYMLELREVAGGGAGERQLDALIVSEAGGRARYHYRARIIVRQGPPEPPRLAGADLAERDPVAGEALYASGVLFHGPRFQGVERVLNSDERRLTMRCRAPRIAERDQGQFPVRTLDPYCADVQFQSMVVWARQHYGAACLPLGLAAGELFRPVPPGATFYVTMDVRQHDAYRLTADLAAHDEAGAVYLRLLGAEMTISAQLNRLFVAAEAAPALSAPGGAP